jgi:hypothetical protein
MSTAELFMEPEEVEEFIRDTLEDDALNTYGVDDGPEIGLCPYTSFYIYHTEDDYLPLVDKMVAIYKVFEKLIDEPFQLVWKDDTQDWLPADDKRLPGLDEFSTLARIQQEDLRPFWIRATDQENPAATARWAIDGKICDGGMRYTTLKLTFRLKWYNQNKTRWQSFVKDCIAQLQPEHCYSGFEVGNGGFNILGAYESDVLERICAYYFYGMDIDHTMRMGSHSYRYHRDDALFYPSLVEGDDPSEKYTNPSNLGAGLRTPTWCFLLPPFWLAKLGKTAADVRAELDDPRIEITTIPYAVGPHNPNGEPALWIRLGELDLHPVENGVPDLLVKANRLIRPIRCDYLNLLTLDPWMDDPNPRFDYESAQRWMRRFDEDSDWPTADKRKAGLPAPAARLRCPAGQPCPREGYWHTPAKTGSRRHFRADEIMPSLGGDYGETIWQWAQDQSAPT